VCGLFLLHLYGYLSAPRPHQAYHLYTVLRVVVRGGVPVVCLCGAVLVVCLCVWPVSLTLIRLFECPQTASAISHLYGSSCGRLRWCSCRVFVWCCSCRVCVCDLYLLHLYGYLSAPRLHQPYHPYTVLRVVVCGGVPVVCLCGAVLVVCLCVWPVSLTLIRLFECSRTASATSHLYGSSCGRVVVFLSCVCVVLFLSCLCVWPVSLTSVRLFECLCVCGLFLLHLYGYLSAPRLHRSYHLYTVLRVVVCGGVPVVCLCGVVLVVFVCVTCISYICTAI